MHRKNSPWLLLTDRLNAFDTSQLVTTLASFAWWQWAAAITATAFSFATLGLYDVLFHRWLSTGVDARRSFMTGISAIAVAQVTGFGLVTATLARWRALQELSMANAVKLTSYVSFSFMMCLGVLALLTVSVATLHSDTAALLGIGTVAGVIGLAVMLSLCLPERLPFAIPPLGLMLRQMCLTTLDVGFAAMALFVFLPEAASIGPTLLFTVFVLSLAAGLISGVPGGLGPFELCLVMLLPMIPAEQLVAAVLAYRLVYYVAPACLGVVWIATAGPPPSRPTAQARANTPALAAETQGLARSVGHDLVVHHATTLHLAPASQTLVALGDVEPHKGLTPDALRSFRQAARARALIPAFYKIGARKAATLRQNGWSVLLISEDASLDLATFTIEGPKRRQLRRKLRQAENAGITIREARTLPLDDMARVSEAWVARNGGERGFSIGRFAVETLRHQRCLLAYRGHHLVGFATFLHTAREWALDLMRSADDTPDGTIHALIAEAAEVARREGGQKLSLGAVPLKSPGRLLRLVQDMDGLRQFKLSFGPKLRPLYLAAPSPLHLAIAGADILMRIRPQQRRSRARSAPALHQMQSRFSETSVVALAITPHIPVNNDASVMRT